MVGENRRSDGIRKQLRAVNSSEGAVDSDKGALDSGE